MKNRLWGKFLVNNNTTVSDSPAEPILQHFTLIQNPFDAVRLSLSKVKRLEKKDVRIELQR